jgi:hypothetical protein
MIRSGVDRIAIAVRSAPNLILAAAGMLRLWPPIGRPGPSG